MQYGPTQIYRCPFCGAEKRLMSLLSGNSIGLVVWSDSYHDYPMFPENSRVQRCPSCGRYYFLDGIRPEAVHDREWEDFGIGTTETGRLDYPQSFEALSQLENCNLTDDRKEWLHMNLLFAFNDWRTRELMVVRKHLRDLEGKGSSWGNEWRESALKQEALCASRQITDADMEIFRSNAEWLMERFPENRLLCAELHREMGDFDECLSILDGIGDNPLTGQFRLKAESRDSEVFRLHLDGVAS